MSTVQIDQECQILEHPRYWTLVKTKGKSGRHSKKNISEARAWIYQFCIAAIFRMGTSASQIGCPSMVSFSIPLDAVPLTPAHTHTHTYIPHFCGISHNSCKEGENDVACFFSREKNEASHSWIVFLLSFSPIIFVFYGYHRFSECTNQKISSICQRYINDQTLKFFGIFADTAQHGSFKVAPLRGCRNFARIAIVPNPSTRRYRALNCKNLVLPYEKLCG